MDINPNVDVNIYYESASDLGSSYIATSHYIVELLYFCTDLTSLITELTN